MAEFKALTAETYEASLEQARRSRAPRAVSVRYDRGRGRIVVRLETGLERARAGELARIEIVGAGSGLHFPALDADLSIGGVLKGRLGSDAWMAARRPARIA